MNAYTDGQIDKYELNEIKLSLIDVFEADPNEVDLVVKAALNNKDNANHCILHIIYQQKFYR